MFSVLFEVQPQEQWESYLAKVLHPDLEQVPGFVCNMRYRSLGRNGWILSLSDWRDEASVVGWLARIGDHEAGEEGSSLILDSRLRVGAVTSDTWVPDVRNIVQQSPYDTRGEGTYVTLIDAKQTPLWVAAKDPQELALYLGFDLYSYGDCISWDIFEAVSSPGQILLVVTWKDAQSAIDHAATQMVPNDARVRVVRIVGDRVMFNRREVPQDHPDAAERETSRA